MAGSSGGSSNPSPAPPPPKILLAKPGLVTGGSNTGKLGRGSGAAEDEASALRNRLPAIGSLNLISESWEFQVDRFLPFLTENTDFTVVGVIGPTGVGKSTIMNEIYGFNGSSPGMLPPFPVQTEDIRAASRHCTTGIEPRISSERIILLDAQPLFCPSTLSEIIRPDGSSTISVLTGESLSAELAHELMAIQLGVFLMSVCQILLVVSEGAHDLSMWRFMSTVDLLKHGIADPSSNLSHSLSSIGLDVGNKDKIYVGGDEYMAAPIFVHTKMEELCSHSTVRLKKALAKYFAASTFTKTKPESQSKIALAPSEISNSHKDHGSDFTQLNLYTIPLKLKDDSISTQHASFHSMLWRLRDKVLSMDAPSFAKTVSERDWLKNSAKIWETVKSSPIIAEYAKMLQSSGAFRK
uniref:Protein SMG9 n=1 Tax=Kalanchoe fedtschenkoi TaxID=63787 RepID=A0A7N0TBC3_KALFE